MMAATGTVFVAAASSPIFRRHISLPVAGISTKKTNLSVSTSLNTRPSLDVSTEKPPTTRSVSENGSLEKKREDELEVDQRLSLNDYFEQSKDLIRSDGGPPRWFSPLDCASRLNNSPLLLFLPGIDGVGLGLISHHQRLGEIFDIWCLHIPVLDRTTFAASCFDKSQIQPLIPLFTIMPEQLQPQVSLRYMLSLMAGDPLKMVRATMEKGLAPQQTFGELSQGVLAMSSYVSVLDDILPRETLLWKLQMLKSASAFVNSRLHAVKAQTLILSSGRDQLLPSLEEGERLRQLLPNCQIRKFNNSGHFLFLEDGFDLVTTIKGAGFYRHARYLDYVSDYVPPGPSEFKQIYEPYRWLDVATGPVMLSTLENEKIVRGLAGIPSEGPVLFVGYHMLLGWELVPLVSRFWIEKNIVVRGIAHPMMFTKLRDGKLPDLSTYDAYRIMGAVPVSGTNIFKLLSSKSHVLLYPGGMREALHRKGEEYKLFWPEQSEFVRMAARFGAKIIPFGAVGEDDVGELFLDYDDLMKIPYFKAEINDLTEESVKLRTDIGGEVANQDVHLPIILPKPPGRFYFYFGKPIETEGRKQELRSREKAHELYLEVQSEVEKCIAYLKEKREKDPYRNIFPRLIYQATHGFDSEVPTFEL
ncbi:phytyl ester synthase 2, chloroplastic-like isoform X2 [Cornus florida]|uniref:phytyl ester synthase 2, chloroplastic-like isoform X2 n=1 Tax=Cornus florida TaxID=4283 RepID=UPI00289A054A|nr:phytyl ester synthase 2, chloroplastic-like isoform X2 [Cornus florida]